MNRLPIEAIMSGENRSVLGTSTRFALATLEPGYRLAIALRNRLFDSGLRQVARLPRATISIGNITTGGTGKTPMVVELANRLRERGSRPAVLLRGYRPSPYRGGSDGSKDSSDETSSLRGELGSSVPVEPDPDRVAAAQQVLDRHGDTDLFLLDDGFQHRQVHRDLDLVLVDATRPFGFGRMLPRGLLREPLTTLRRADAVVITHTDLVDHDALAKLDDRIADVAGRSPIAHTAHRWIALRDDVGQRSLQELRSMKVIGACGIGNPRSFRPMLAQAAGQILDLIVFDDHHAYTHAEVDTVLHRARHQGADAVITTEKDWTKWQRLLADHVHEVPVLRPVLKIEFLDGREALEALILKTVRHWPVQRASSTSSQ